MLQLSSRQSARHPARASAETPDYRGMPAKARIREKRVETRSAECADTISWNPLRSRRVLRALRYTETTPKQARVSRTIDEFLVRKFLHERTQSHILAAWSIGLAELSMPSTCEITFVFDHPVARTLSIATSIFRSGSLPMVSSGPDHAASNQFADQIVREPTSLEPLKPLTHSRTTIPALPCLGNLASNPAPASRARSFHSRLNSER